MRKKNESVVQSVGRALHIVSCFTGNEDELGITDIAERMALSKSTVHGLVSTLAQAGYLEKTSKTNKYRLGIKFYEMGKLVESRMDLRSEAKPYNQKLAEKYRLVVHVAQMIDDEIIYIDKEDIKDFTIDYSYPGKRANMHCTAVGKALMAYLPDERIERILRKPMKRFTPKTITDPDELRQVLHQVREKGYAMDNEETVIGSMCIAAPVFTDKQRPIAAISCTGPTIRFTENVVETLSKDIVGYTARISKRMGGA